MDFGIKKLALSSFKKSVFLHGLLIALFLVNIFFFRDQQVNYIPAIKVDIVDLPDKRPVEKKASSAQALPQKKVAKPPPPPPKKALVKTSKPLQKKALVKKSKSKVSKQDDLQQQAIERLQSLQKIQKMVEAEEIKGNRIQPGTALMGLNKIDYDNYTGRLHHHVQSHWQLPKWLAVSEGLSTVVRVYLNSEGHVISKELLQSSGDARFDQIVLSAIDEASPFPKPENRFADLVKTGITLNLKP